SCKDQQWKEDENEQHHNDRDAVHLEIGEPLAEMEDSISDNAGKQGRDGHQHRPERFWGRCEEAKAAGFVRMINIQVQWHSPNAKKQLIPERKAPEPTQQNELKKRDAD